MVADIQIPTVETKIAILKTKAEQNGAVLPDDVACFIASRVVANIRELEGSLIRVIAFASLTNQPITLELAQRVLQRTAEVKLAVKIDFNHIMSCVQKHYSYSLEDLRSQSRSKQLTMVRQIAMYLMKKLTDKSLQEIGYHLGRKDHSTVIHAFSKVQQQMDADPTFCAHVKALEQELLP